MKVSAYLNMTGISSAGKGAIGWGAVVLVDSMPGVWAGSEGGNPQGSAG